VDHLPGLMKPTESVLPDALLLETIEEAFDHPVLLRGVGSDELLRKAVVAKGRPEAPTSKEQTVVASHRGRLMELPETEEKTSRETNSRPCWEQTRPVCWLNRRVQVLYAPWMGVMVRHGMDPNCDVTASMNRQAESGELRAGT
jgi:hypothetical protein